MQLLVERPLDGYRFICLDVDTMLSALDLLLFHHDLSQVPVSSLNCTGHAELVLDAQGSSILVKDLVQVFFG